MKIQTKPIHVLDVSVLRASFEQLARSAMSLNASPAAKTLPLDPTDKKGVEVGRTPFTDVTDAFRSVPRENLLIDLPLPFVAADTAGSTIEPVRNVRADDFEFVTTRAVLPEIAGRIVEAGVVALDVETYGAEKNDGLNPWRGQIRLLSLMIQGQKPWVIDLQAVGTGLGPLREALASVEVIGHNVKFDLLWLAVHAGCRPSRVYCTMIASRLLTAGTDKDTHKKGNDLNGCLLRVLGVEAAPDHSTSDWSAPDLRPEQLAYAARDVVHLHALRNAMDRQLAAAKMARVRDLEMDLIPVVVQMEANGMPVDADRLQQLHDAAATDTAVQTARVRELLKAPTLNPRSQPQLKAALANVGIVVESTGEDVLRAVAPNEVIPAILAMRSADKLQSKTKELLENLPPDGRIHSRFTPGGCVTGRFSSSKPNLQNVTRGPLRESFAAPVGKRLVIADYSQVELRVAAAVAGEEKMLLAYRAKADLHAQTAAGMTGKDVGDVTKQERQMAKAVSFGNLYGQGPARLAQKAGTDYNVAMTEAEAGERQAQFFATYPGLARWQASKKKAASDSTVTEVRTVLGRRRLLPADCKDNWWTRYSTLLNHTIQGSCADGMKIAMVRLAKKLPPSARMVATIHDELIVEADNADAEMIRSLVETTMVEAMSELFPEVAMEVESHIASNWGGK